MAHVWPTYGPRTALVRRQKTEYLPWFHPRNFGSAKVYTYSADVFRLDITCCVHDGGFLQTVGGNNIAPPILTLPFTPLHLILKCIGYEDVRDMLPTFPYIASEWDFNIKCRGVKGALGKVVQYCFLPPFEDFLKHVEPAVQPSAFSSEPSLRREW